jgi:hypothetical protein
VEWVLDGDFTRFALVAIIPLLYCVSLVRVFLLLLIDVRWLTINAFDSTTIYQFFALQIVQNVSMMYVFPAFLFPYTDN